MSFKINKVNEIPEKCLDNDTHLYIKEDGTLYVNKKDGSIISIGGKEIDLSGYIKKEEFHNHTNLDNLNKIGEDSEGNLTYNGNLVNKDMDITNIENNINEQHSKIESIENTVSEYDSRIQQVETNVSEYDSRLESVETNVSEYDSRIEELENKFNTEIEETHNHTNLDNLNKIGEDSEGNLTYNGEPTLTNKDFEVFKTNTIGTSELSTEDKTIKGSINEILNSVNNNMSSIINVEKNINDLFLVKDEFNSIIEKESVSFANEFIDGNIDIQTGELIDNEENIKYIRNKSTIIIGKESVISLQYSKENDLFTDVVVFAYTNENYIGNAELNMTTDDIDKYYNILLPENTNIIKIVFKIADERIQSDYVTLANSIDIKLNKLYIKEYNIKRFDNLNTSIKDLQTVVKSKNLFDGRFEKGYLNKLDGSKIDITTNKCARTYFIGIDKGIENITLQRTEEQSLISNITALAYDSEFKFIKQLELKRFSIDNKLCHNINLTNDIKYIKVAFIIPNDKIGDDYLDYFNSMNFQIEAGLEATEYEPHKLFVKKDKIEGFNDLEEKVNELFTSVSNGKNLLETAITDKGGVVSKSGDIATFDELKSGILDVPTSNCKLNIFTQSTEPITKQGLWLKTDNTYDKIEDFNNTKFDSFKYTVTDHGYDGGYVKQYTKCVKVGKYAYLIGGNSVTSRNLRYDLETNQTATMTSIPSDYYSSSPSAPNFCCSDNINKIFLIQCGSNGYKSAQYNINTNTYTALGFSEVTYRREGDSCYYKNKIYCFSISSNYNYIYNLDTTTVTNMTSININKPKIVLIDDNVYLISDNNSSGNCYKYNLTTGTVTTLTTSPLRTDRLTVYNHGNYIYQCSPSSDIEEGPSKLAIVRYDILNNKHERIMETVGTSDPGSHYCGVIYNNKLLLFHSSETYYIDFILNKNCLYLDKSDNTNNALLVETPYELLNKKETFKSCFLTDSNSVSISCNTYIGNGTSWNKI